MRKVRLACIVILLVSVFVLAGIKWNLSSKGMEWNPEGVTVVKAPEQTEAMEHEYFKVEEYISVLPEGENIIRQGKIDASSFTDVYTPRKTTDGNAKGVSYWEGEKDTYPNILSVQFDEPQTIHASRICLCPLPVWGKRTQTFSVEISADGESYEEIIPLKDYEFNPNKNNEVILEFDEVEVMGVRLCFTANTGAGGAQVAEWEIYQK